MFKECINLEESIHHVVSQKEFVPITPYNLRAEWEQIDDYVREYFMKQKTYLINYQFKSLSATDYIRFSIDGNRVVYENIYFEKRQVLFSLIVLELIEGKGECLAQIIDGVWNLCEESSWVIPAHNNHMQCQHHNKLPDINKKDFIDLFAAETAAVLAWVYYFFRDELNKVTPLITERLKDEVTQRVNGPYLRYDNMCWMGLDGAKVNNWNPWIVGNCLISSLLLESDEDKRKQAVLKSTQILDEFLDQYIREYADGGCDEGASYWNAAGACLFDSLEMLYNVTEGHIDLYQENLILNIGEYIAKMYVAGNRFINFADGSIQVPLSYEQIYRFGQRVDSQYMMQFAKALGQYERYPHISVNGFFTYRSLQDIVNFRYNKDKKYNMPYQKDIWLENLQVFCARVDETGEGCFVSAKGGHNNESHNHNDIGSFIVYDGAEPIVIDPGVETYTAKTFSPKRYELWTMQSDYHNLPSINGVMQEAGRQYQAKNVRCKIDNHYSLLELELQDAYAEEAQIDKLYRTIKLDRIESQIEIIDDIHTNKDKNEYILNIMTLRKPVIEDREVRLPGKRDYTISYPEVAKVECEIIPLTDPKMSKDWGSDKMYRLRFKAQFKQKDSFKLIIKTDI